MNITSIDKYIKANYTKQTLFQLSRMLDVDIEYIQERLEHLQLRKAGSRAAASVLILRDPVMFEEDSHRFNSELL